MQNFTTFVNVSPYRRNSGKKVHSLTHLIKLLIKFSCFPRFGSEYAQTLSAKNLLVWDKNLCRGSVGTSKRREFE